MTRARLPRWPALVVLPLLVGALLLMHGLDATMERAPSTALARVSHAHADDPVAAHVSTLDTDGRQQGEQHCGHCSVAHLMTVVCVAVLTAAASLHVAARLFTRAPGRACDRAGRSRRRSLVGPLRSRDPAWVRLAVMQC